MVIGGGSGGATVASRLSEENRFSVLLLEAGLDEPTGTQIPSFFFNFLGSEIDWQYTTESEDEACLNKEDRKCYWPRGKVCLLLLPPLKIKISNYQFWMFIALSCYYS